MAGGLWAVFKALADDAAQAGRNVGEALAGFFGKTADNEDENVVRMLDAEAGNVRAISAIRENAAGRLPATGAGGYIESLSPEAEAAYAAIRANEGDVSKIAENTGISQDIIAQVKNHLFMTEHDAPVGPNEVAHGYFTADEEIASQWSKAEAGTLSSADQETFRSLIAHEYVESRLMESGLPYRSADPEAWQDGVIIFSRLHFGAHEVAPLSSDGSLKLWPELGLAPPAAPLAADLSNIDDLVNAARRGLGL